MMYVLYNPSALHLKPLFPPLHLSVDLLAIRQGTPLFSHDLVFLCLSVSLTSADFPCPCNVARLPSPCTTKPPASLDQPIPVPISSRDWRFGHYKRAPHSVMVVRGLQLLRCWSSDAAVVADWLYGYVSGIVFGKPHIEALGPNKSVDEL